MEGFADAAKVPNQLTLNEVRYFRLFCWTLLNWLCVLVTQFSAPKLLVTQFSVSDSLQCHGLELTWLLCMEFSLQEYCSGLPFPSPRDLPNPRIEPRSPALQTDSLISEPPGKPFGWP